MTVAEEEDVTVRWKEGVPPSETPAADRVVDIFVGSAEREVVDWIFNRVDGPPSGLAFEPTPRLLGPLVGPTSKTLVGLSCRATVDVANGVP